MPAVTVRFYKPRREDLSRDDHDRWREHGALFEGTVDPDGPEGYVFSGTLSATCQVVDAGITNTVALGHGGASADFSYEKREIKGTDENVYEISGRGKRALNEDVDFRLGINLHNDGSYEYGDKVTAPAGGPRQLIEARYDEGGVHVIFRGHAWADGPEGYAIEGRLIAKNDKVSTTQEYATLGYGSESGSWHYETIDFDSSDSKKILVRGSRDSDEGVAIIVGTTSGTLNTYKYCDKVICAPLRPKFEPGEPPAPAWDRPLSHYLHLLVGPPAH
ncbi:hypothetical protein AB0G74_10895 [Streptomyces sp. NPDC020875]|uniref:hypothetical protein n=1 Tax=Streptomyces sp. NPDC020875 TaxID=3154898 RepID=UPI00340C54A3